MKTILQKIRTNPILRNEWMGRFVKTIIILAASYSIYTRITAKENVDELYTELLSNLTFPNFYWLLGALILFPIIPLLEGVTWKMLLKKIIPNGSNWQMFKAVLIGYTLSIFTPNGIGKGFAPIIIFKTKRKADIFAATYVTAMARQSLVAGFGTVGIVLLFNRFFEGQINAFAFAFGLSVFLVSLNIFLYYNLHYFIKIIEKIPLVRKYANQIQVITTFSKKELTHVLIIAGIWAVVMLVQYYLVLRFFGINAPIWEGVPIIAAIFLLRSYIPLPPSLGIVLRAEIALQFWGMYCDNEISILAATFTLWILNVVSFAIIGMVFIGGMKVFKEEVNNATLEIEK